MKKYHFTQHNSPAGKDFSSHMKSIGHVFESKDKSIRRKAEQLRTNVAKSEALKSKKEYHSTKEDKLVSYKEYPNKH